ncbi:adenosylcobinamide amidohydrolase [Solwaraspora sp. WMMD792]|uniref:adenosylcobinamide amidohydrolase n=1 Tax=Solwaraspora sp. WMMD792 TaxID=3016099 RepID=UPI002417C915|nr:adenosylcobinamide amidohydrolase [Solwaraspora sp. WMMD792]MDG4773481.1 adenosylcobinamide amidohydrolase [Solwaraspora sp. WMMD792]
MSPDVARPWFTTRTEDGRTLPYACWALTEPLLAISSAPLGGGIGLRWWVINATVPMSYHRDDPDTHLVGLAEQADLRGPGVGLLTGVDVRRMVTRDEAGVQVWATVGLGTPVLAAAPSAAGPAPPPAGTINIVAALPVRLGEAALVNAVATITEAKTQALVELGLRATGTATDAVVVLCPPDGPEQRYGGPRSTWGARLARVAHAAVRGGTSRHGGTADSQRRQIGHSDKPAGRLSSPGTPGR